LGFTNTLVGIVLGAEEGLSDGWYEGPSEGMVLGPSLGILEGIWDGSIDGISLGMPVGEASRGSVGARSKKDDSISNTLEVNINTMMTAPTRTSKQQQKAHARYTVRFFPTRLLVADAAFLDEGGFGWTCCCVSLPLEDAVSTAGTEALASREELLLVGIVLTRSRQKF
jgi:hypothetical protein